LTWYRAEDWSTLKAMFPDGDQLHDTHAKWLAEVEKVEKRLRRDGHVVKRVYIEPAVFPRLVSASEPDHERRCAHRVCERAGLAGTRLASRCPRPDGVSPLVVHAGAAAEIRGLIRSMPPHRIVKPAGWGSEAERTGA
jgi:hypothetical protein